MRLISETIPRAYKKLINSLDQVYSIGHFFDRYNHEFVAAITCLFMLAKNEFDADRAVLVKEWLELFGNATDDNGRSTMYHFHLRTLFDSKETIYLEDAKHLFAHFAGSYQYHSDSYKRRFGDFVLFRKKEDIPEFMFDVLVNQIRHIQNAFFLDTFKAEDFAEIDLAVKSWQQEQNNSERLKNCIIKYFRASDDIGNPARVVSLGAVRFMRHLGIDFLRFTGA